MPTPHASSSFGDLLDTEFQEIFHEEYAELPSMLGNLFDMVPHNGRDTIKYSQIGAFKDWNEFDGTVEYDDLAQGTDTVATYKEFASGFQVERSLFDDDQYGIMNEKPKGLALSLNRTREGHGARIFNQAFNNDTFFYVNSEGVPLCSDSHTSPDQDTSTAVGFDNLATAALSATALIAARIQHVQLRDTRANRISIMPDEIWIPNNLYDVAWEIVNSRGRPDTAENQENVSQGQFKIMEWNYLNDTNNWFLVDSRLRRMSIKWIDRVSVEFGFAEDLDTIIAKWRGYSRYANLQRDWRWILGSQVA